MPFEIIIKQTGTERKVVDGKWEVIDQTFMSKEDWDKLNYFDAKKLEAGELKDLKKQVYGYTPKVEREVSFDKEVYRQTVEKVDLSKVIKAVNDL